MRIFSDEFRKNNALPVPLLRQVFFLPLFLYFFVVFSGRFREAFWSDFGVILEPFCHHFSIIFSIGKYIDFLLASGRSFREISRVPTLDFGALAYTKRSFSQNHLFRLGVDF